MVSMQGVKEGIRRVVGYLRGAVFVLVLGIFFSFINIPYAFSLPQIDEVVNGEVKIMRPDDKTMEIEATDRSIITYRRFDIGVGEKVIINLPSATSSILNRVIGGSVSEILGSLISNGVVIVVNSAGIHIGRLADIDVGSLIMSTRDISN